MAGGTAVAGLPAEAIALLVGAREARGWSTSELGRELRCSRRYVTMVEAGDRVPSGPVLEAWARVLRLDDDATRSLLHAWRDAVRTTR